MEFTVIEAAKRYKAASKALSVAIASDEGAIEEHGEWLVARNLLDRDIKSLAIALLLLTDKNGGVTFSLESGVQEGAGYVVAIDPEREAVLPPHLTITLWTEQWVYRNLDLLTEPGYCIGTWVSDGKLYLDVVKVFKSKKEAEKVARENKQLAYYDLKKKKEIFIGA